MKTILEITCQGWQAKDDPHFRHAWLDQRTVWHRVVVPEPVQAWPFYPYSLEWNLDEPYHPRLYLETIGGDLISTPAVEQARFHHHEIELATPEERDSAD